MIVLIIKGSIWPLKNNTKQTDETDMIKTIIKYTK